MRQLIKMLQEIKNCDLDWVLGWGGLRWGSTEESIMRMLLQIEKARLIEIDVEGKKITYIAGKKKPEEEEKTEKENQTK